MQELSAKRLPVDFVEIDYDPDGLYDEMREHYEEDGVDVDEDIVALEVVAYRRTADKAVNSLGCVTFFKNSLEWTTGRFERVSEIPAACGYLREIARDMGLRE